MGEQALDSRRLRVQTGTRTAEPTMKIHCFKSLTKPDTYAFTADTDGTCLPQAIGPWKRFKFIDVDQINPPKIAGPLELILAGIEKDGYYVTSVPIAIVA